MMVDMMVVMLVVEMMMMLMVVVMLVMLLPHPRCGEAGSSASSLPLHHSITQQMIPSEEAAKKQEGSTQKLVSLLVHNRSQARLDQIDEGSNGCFGLWLSPSNRLL